MGINGRVFCHKNSVGDVLFVTADVASQSNWDLELVAHICGTSTSVLIDDNFTLMMIISFVVPLGKLYVYLDW